MVATVIAGAPLGWMTPVTSPMVVPFGEGWSVGLTCPLVQSTVTNGVDAAMEDLMAEADGLAEAAGADDAGAAVAAVVADAAGAEDPDTRSSVCLPQAATVRIRTAAVAASKGFFTPSA